MAVLLQEPEAEAFEEVLLTASALRISAATVLEARIVADCRSVLSRLNQMLEELPVVIEPISPAVLDAAFQGFRTYGKGRHPAALNYGDCFAYGLARATGLPLLFKGDDFSRTDVESALPVG